MASARWRRRALLCSASICLGLSALPAAAQEADAGTFLGRIVFSFGLPRVAIDTPQSVTVVDQEDIDSRQPATVRDALEGVPGVQLAGVNAPLGQAFNIRGVGMTEEPSAERRVVVRVDGAPKFFEQYRMGSFFGDPELYRQIEVLRGPASSTLYGAGALGGVVNFTTKDASDFLENGDDFALRTRIGYRSNGDQRLASVIAAQRFDAFETLSALTWRQSDNYEDGDGNEILATSGEGISGLVKGTWHLADEQTLRLSFQQFDSALDDAPVAATGGGPAMAMFGTIDRHVVDRTVVLAWENPLPANDWLDVTAQLSWSRVTSEQFEHTPASPSVVCAPGRSAILCDADYGYDTLVARVENRATLGGEGWDAFLTFGAEAGRTIRSAESEVGALDFHPEGEDRFASLYAQGEIVIGERLTLVPGLRADFTDRDPSEDVPGAEAISASALSPKLAAIYEVSDAFSVFGSVARTERLPTLDELYAYSVTQAPSPDLAEEASVNAELGFALDLMDVLTSGDSLQLKATLFRNDVENLIQRTAATQPTYYENISDARFEGYELELGYDSERVFAQLGYASVDAQDVTFGYRLNSNPQDLLTATLGTRLPQWGLEIGWRGHFAAAITTGSRSTTTGAITYTEHEGYVTHDLFAEWEPEGEMLKGFAVNFGIDNVTDETWRNNLAAQGDNGPGRSVALTLTRTF